MATQTLSQKLHKYVININNPSDANTRKYKAHRNKLNKLIRTTEKKYYEEKFVEATDDMKKTWKIIKNIISRNKQNSLTESHMLITVKSLLTKMRLCTDLMNSLLILDQHWLVKYSPLTETISSICVEISLTRFLYF